MATRERQSATAEALLVELRELTRDVTGDARARARRLALLRRVERQERDHGTSGGHSPGLVAG